MNKIESEHSSRIMHEPRQEDVGVGDYLADPQREVMHWKGVYLEGKFYITDPQTYEKLQEVEANIDLQKKMAISIKGSEPNRAESVRQFDPRLGMSGYSYATEHNAQKSKLKQFEAEKQLNKEEETNFKRMLEVKQKKQI